MHVEQKRLAVLDQPVGVLQVGFALADGLDLGAAQGHAGLEFFQEKVVVAGGAILGGVALAGSHGVAGPHGFLGPERSLGTITWLVWRGTAKYPRIFIVASARESDYPGPAVAGRTWQTAGLQYVAQSRTQQGFARMRRRWMGVSSIRILRQGTAKGAARSRERARQDAEEFDESPRCRTGRIQTYFSDRAFRSSGRVRRRIGYAACAVGEVLVQAGPGCRSARRLRRRLQRLSEGLFDGSQGPDLQGSLSTGCRFRRLRCT